MLRAAFNLLDIWPIIAIKISRPWAEHNSHATRSGIAATTLTVVIASPRVYISRSAEEKRMDIAAFDINWPFVKEDLN